MTLHGSISTLYLKKNQHKFTEWTDRMVPPKEEGEMATVERKKEEEATRDRCGRRRGRKWELGLLCGGERKKKRLFKMVGKRRDGKLGCI